jgi:hypothetical protein
MKAVHGAGDLSSEDVDTAGHATRHGTISPLAAVAWRYLPVVWR